MMDSIFSMTLPGFIFFLLIVCVGYIATGDLSTKTKTNGFVPYKTKWSLERLIIYILRWISINLVSLFLFSKTLINIINPVLVKSSGYIFNIQIIMVSLSYFLVLSFFVWLIKNTIILPAIRLLKKI
jgi:hypothetical protein